MPASLTPQAVLQLEQRRRDAMLAGDAAALTGLISAQVIYVHSTGARDTRESYLRKIGAGTLRYLQLDFSELQAEVTPGAALVTGRMQAVVLREERQIPVRSAFLTVWVPEDGSWRLRAHQGTPLND